MNNEIKPIEPVKLSDLSAQSGQYAKQQYQKVKDRYDAIPEERKQQMKSIFKHALVALGIAIAAFMVIVNKLMKRHIN